VETTQVSQSDAILPRSRRSSLADTIRAILHMREFGIFAFLLLVVIVMGSAQPTFFTLSNFLSMGRQMAQIAIIAVAMTYVLTAAELDLSVGSTFGLCSMTMALLTQDLGIDLWFSLFIALGLGAIIGLVNGLLTTVGRIPSFIVTLGMLSVLRGITLVLSAWPVSRLAHPTFYNVLAGEIGGVPVQLLWMLAIVIVGALALQHTKFGYHVRATGSNRAAAELAGVDVKRVKVMTFILVGVAAAFAGALSFAHLKSVAPVAGAGIELGVIAAVVIGGSSMSGGEGTIIGTFLGAAMLTFIRNGLVQLGGEGRLQESFLGLIIIAAVLIHTHLKQRRE
jgi:ribose transport system permease protein